MRTAGVRSRLRSCRFWPCAGAPRHPGCPWLPRDARFDVPQRFHCAGEFPWCISMTHWWCQLIHLCDTTLLFLTVAWKHPLFFPPRGTVLTAAPANQTKRRTEIQKSQFYRALPLVLLFARCFPRILLSLCSLQTPTRY